MASEGGDALAAGARPWTPEEDSFVLNDHGMTDEDMMVLLGRPYRQVHPHRLGLLVGAGLLTPEEADSLYFPVDGMPGTWRGAYGRYAVAGPVASDGPDAWRGQWGFSSPDGWERWEDRLAMMHGFSYEQVAMLTGRTVEAVRCRVYRLKTRWREWDVDGARLERGDRLYRKKGGTPHGI